MDDFQELEPPEIFITNNGLTAGWVVRVAGLDRSLMLNNISLIQDSLVVATPVGSSRGSGKNMYYHTTALFANGQMAWDAASKYYRDHGEVYPYAIVIDTSNLYPKFVYMGGATIDATKKDATENNWGCESQTMVFT